MPIANVVRIMRRVLPPHAKLSDDAKELIQESVSEFISFVTGEANDRCHGEHRKTVTAEDVVWAMERLGFDNYAALVRAYLQRMRDSEDWARGDRAHHQAAVAMSAVQGLQAQHVPAPNAAVARGNGAVPLQVPAISATPRSGTQHVVLGREEERSMASVADGSPPSCCAEGTSSSNEEMPAGATTPRPQYRN